MSARAAKHPVAGRETTPYRFGSVSSDVAGLGEPGDVKRPNLASDRARVTARRYNQTRDRMRTRRERALFGVAVLLLLLTALAPRASASGADLDTVFRHPPESARPWVYWYWMNAAVSRAGITADLEAMKQAGLEGAYLMPIKGPAEPPLVQPVAVQLSPGWWDDVRFAFAEADRLGLKLALQDCDGFATAGGPWITPKLSMQKVVWTETRVEGGRQVDQALRQPETNENYYRDIAVFAVPASDRAPSAWPTVTSSQPGTAPQFLAAGTGGTFQSSSPCWIQYAYAAPFTCRAITISLPPASNAYQPNTYGANRLTVQASDDGGHFRTVTRLIPPRHGWQDGDADITHAIPPVTARYFRFLYDPANAEPGAEDLDSAKWKPGLKVRGIRLQTEPRIDGFEGKSGAVWRVGPPTLAAAVPANDAVPLAKVLDISAHVDATGRLSWDAPPGNWIVYRMGHTSTGHRNDTGGGGKGLECDKFNPVAIRSQFDHWFGEAIRQVGPELAHRVLTVFHVDSWECASQNWSPVFRDEFRRRRGYDPLPYLPAMAGVPIESVDASERFLRDVRTTIAELLVDNFFGTMAALAHEHGCVFTAESVAPTMASDGMAHYAKVDVPMGEFWLRSPTHDKLNDVLDAVSGAHVYGRPVAQMEAFTELALRWDEAPAMLKALQDRNYCLGVNRFVYHVFAENPWTDRRPGMTLNGVGLYFQRDQTWWKPGRAWIEYAERCNALLQQGRPAADVAVFTGEEVPRRAYVPWHLASTLPGMIAPVNEIMVGRKEPRIMEAGDWVDPLQGYAYDSINRDALLRLAEVRAGRLQLPGGASYRVLVVPAANPMNPVPEALTPEVAEKLRAFAASGGIVILGARPSRSPSLEPADDADAQVARAAGELWHTGVAADGMPHAYGKGTVVTGPYRERTFDRLALSPDVVIGASDRSAEPAKRDLGWIHRAGDGWDLYFVSNQLELPRELTLSFRQTGRVPELWDAVTGEQRFAANWRTAKGRTEVALQLPPSGSVFVVFRAPANDAVTADPMNGPPPATTATLAGPWSVQFDPAFGGPSAPLTFTQLDSWTAHAEPGLRNYSGTATYRKTIEWSAATGKPHHVWLDLGIVHDLAEVTLNGTPCGVAWTPPYRVDIGRALREGANEVRVAVTNTWFNRLAGDQDLPEAQRRTWTTAPDRTKGKPLLEAGLLGPVKLLTE